MNSFQHFYAIFLALVSVSSASTVITTIACSTELYGAVDCTVACIQLNFGLGSCGKFKTCECTEILSAGDTPVYTTGVQCDDGTPFVRSTDQVCITGCKKEINYSFGYCDEDKLCFCSTTAVKVQTTGIECNDEPYPDYENDITYCQQKCTDSHFSLGYCNSEADKCVCENSTDVFKINAVCTYKPIISVSDCEAKCKTDFKYSYGYCTTGMCRCSNSRYVLTLDMPCEKSLLKTRPSDACVAKCNDLGYTLKSCNSNTNMCQCGNY